MALRTALATYPPQSAPKTATNKSRYYSDILIRVGSFPHTPTGRDSLLLLPYNNKLISGQDHGYSYSNSR